MLETALRGCNPFYLFKKKTKEGPIWYARYKNDKTGKYNLARSTGVHAEGKKERKREAELKAQEMLSQIRFETETADQPQRKRHSHF